VDFEAVRRGSAALVLGLLLTGCGAGLRKFPLRDPMWRDPDQHPFRAQPEEYFSPFAWDAANQTVFRPISRFFAADPAGEAVNVNALDEVPDSSWFTNRIGRLGISPEQAATGSCDGSPPRTDRPWVVKAAKPNGFNPGFFIEVDGKKYLMKFDGTLEGTRPTAADVISTRFFHAAGYFVPCDRIVYFNREILEIAPSAKSENAEGEKVPLTSAVVDRVFEKALRLPDGRYRASISLFVEGKVLGPWTYEGRRSDDPNDVIDHQDRRELRGMEVLAAWLGYYDSREQNTMASFVSAGDGGYVRHYMLDVGNAFGSVWEPPMLGRRITHSYYLDFPYLLEDFVTLGMIRRPWDRARISDFGSQFGYYDADNFDPDRFRPGYPNPAFVRKSERDSAWMARIIAHFEEPVIRAIVKAGRLAPEPETRLLTVLRGRREKILRRYLARLSPLTAPVVNQRGGRARLCLDDLALLSAVTRPDERRYAVRAFVGDALAETPVTGVTLERGHIACFELPDVPGASASSPGYLVLDVFAASRGHEATLPARVHLYHFGANDYRVVGLERPYDRDAPEG
jgi:hypothetical protein